jgi:hypothetical protein
VTEHDALVHGLFPLRLFPVETTDAINQASTTQMLVFKLKQACSHSCYYLYFVF